MNTERTEISKKPKLATKPPSDLLSELFLLEYNIGYYFKDKELLKKALSHPSLSSDRSKSYEQLEFLGDKILNMIIADELFTRFPEDSDGQLSIKLNNLVSGKVITVIGKSIGIGANIMMSAPEARSYGQYKDSNIENSTEALIGAIYKDSNIEASKAVVLKLWIEHLELSMTMKKDAKSQLQEWLQSRKFPLPEYVMVARTGPAHALNFEIQIIARGLPTFNASGRSIKEAELNAAILAVEYINNRNQESKIKNTPTPFERKNLNSSSIFVKKK